MTIEDLWGPERRRRGLLIIFGMKRNQLWWGILAFSSRTKLSDHYKLHVASCPLHAARCTLLIRLQPEMWTLPSRGSTAPTHLRRDRWSLYHAERQKCVNVCELELERWNADFNSTQLDSLLCSPLAAFSYNLQAGSRRIRPWNGANWKQSVRLPLSCTFAWDLRWVGGEGGGGIKLPTCVPGVQVHMQQSGKIPVSSYTPNSTPAAWPATLAHSDGIGVTSSQQIAFRTSIQQTLSHPHISLLTIEFHPTTQPPRTAPLINVGVAGKQSAKFICWVPPLTKWYVLCPKGPLRRLCNWLHLEKVQVSYTSLYTNENHKIEN